MNLKSMALLVRRFKLAQLPPVNKGSSTGVFTAVKTTVNQAVASVTALATDSAPRPSPAAGSHQAGVYSENYVNNLKHKHQSERDRIKQVAV